jgi:hypothetical protein
VFIDCILVREVVIVARYLDLNIGTTDRLIKLTKKNLSILWMVSYPRHGYTSKLKSLYGSEHYLIY